MLPPRDTISSGLRFSKDHIFTTVDSSNALNERELSERAAVAPPPSVSFRTKAANDKRSTVSLDSVTPKPEKELGTVLESQSGSTQPSEVSDRSMSEFYALRNGLSLSTLMWTGIILLPVWFFYDQNIALNYLFGAVAGLVYLRLLARNVERLGTGSSVGKSQLAVFVGVVIIATQIDTLHVLPVFLGFLTYKVAILVYALRTAVFDSVS